MLYDYCYWVNKWLKYFIKFDINLTFEHDILLFWIKSNMKWLDYSNFMFLNFNNDFDYVVNIDGLY